VGAKRHLVGLGPLAHACRPTAAYLSNSAENTVQNDEQRTAWGRLATPLSVLMVTTGYNYFLCRLLV